MGSIPTQVLRFFFQEEKSQDLYTSATVMILDELGLMARASSRVPR